MKNTYKHLLLAIALLLLLVQTSMACSAIFGSDSSKVLVGSNEDYYYSEPFVWFTKPTDKKYGCAFFCYDVKYPNPHSLIKIPLSGKIVPQQALNDKGLYYDFFGTPLHEIEKNDDMRKGHQIRAVKEMMYECQDVEEAMKFLENQYSRFFKGCKIFLADELGNYVIYDGKDFIRKNDNDYYVVTNFLENNKELGNFPCPRYTKASELLNDNKELSSGNFSSILKATHQNSDYLDMGTIYSLICDLKSGDINLYYYQNFEQSHIINIHEELEKGTRIIKLSDLFPKRSFPVLYKTLVKHGVESAINKLTELESDEDYNKSESEYIFFCKALYNMKYYKEAEEIIKICLEKYPDSVTGKAFLKKVLDQLKIKSDNKLSVV